MQCIYDIHLRCKNTYYSRGVEMLSCWSENKEFLTALKWYIDFCMPCIPMDPNIISAQFKPYDDYMQRKRAEMYAWFNDELSPTQNNIFIIEPWVQSGALNIGTKRLEEIKDNQIVMNDTICAVLKVAEWRYIDSRFKLGD